MARRHPHTTKRKVPKRRGSQKGRERPVIYLEFHAPPPLFTPSYMRLLPWPGLRCRAETNMRASTSSEVAASQVTLPALSPFQSCTAASHWRTGRDSNQISAQTWAAYSARSRSQTIRKFDRPTAVNYSLFAHVE